MSVSGTRALDASHRASSAASAVAARPVAVAAWLLACCALLFAMIVVGGVTRLTHSGLSITEWQPIVGTIPPLSSHDWNDAFARYQLTPEYRQVNAGMTLEAFKSIFWWEYAHRLLGRLIGVVFLLPLLVFAARRMIPPGLGVRLGVIFALGAAQGALGWYMVQSGLVDDPRVSSLRLTAHLGLAFLILAAMLWTALELLRPLDPKVSDRGPFRFAAAVAALVFAMVLSGGLVAGIRAGFAYNTFPLMQGHWIPPEILMLDPWYRNFHDNMATVQFVHRAIALLLAIVIPAFTWRALRAPAPGVRHAGAWLLAALVVQLALGIATLLMVVPVPLAALHQAGAVLLFAAALNALSATRVGRSGLRSPAYGPMMTGPRA